MLTGRSWSTPARLPSSSPSWWSSGLISSSARPEGTRSSSRECGTISLTSLLSLRLVPLNRRIVDVTSIRHLSNLLLLPLSCSLCLLRSFCLLDLIVRQDLLLSLLVFEATLQLVCGNRTLSILDVLLDVEYWWEEEVWVFSKALVSMLLCKELEKFLRESHILVVQ